jgi:hypothetical protein
MPQWNKTQAVPLKTFDSEGIPVTSPPEGPGEKIFTPYLPSPGGEVGFKPWVLESE